MIKEIKVILKMMILRKKLSILIFSGFLLTSCVSDDTGQPVQGGIDLTADLQGLLENVADQIIIPNYDAVLVSANAFAQPGASLSNYCASIGTLQESETLGLARNDWRSLASLIAEVDLHAVGPVLENQNLLLNLLNSYNVGSFSSCGVDQAAVQNFNDVSFTIESRVVNQRGIGALEFLLFNESATFSCPISVSQTNDWNALSSIQQKMVRCDYAQVVLDDLVRSAGIIVNAWSPLSGNYREVFVATETLEANFNALSDALFALEDIVKDRKLGEALGIRDAFCAAIACPEVIESPYSEHSLSNIQNNLLSFEQIFLGLDDLGVDGQGFDDIIIANGFQSVVDEISVAISDALDYVVTIQSGESLSAQVEEIITSGDDSACISSNANPDANQDVPACSLHGYMKRITDIMRTSFLYAVNLDLPVSTQGDGD